MEQKNLTEQKTVTAEMDITQTAKYEQELQIRELTEITNALIQTVQTMQMQTAQKAKFDDTMTALKTAATSIMVNPAVPQQYAQPVVDKCGCKDDPCGCVSTDCCSFDIVMSYIRVLGMQTELDDSNLNPWGEMEVRCFAYLDGGIGAVIPSMFSTLTLRKLINHPGLKIGVNRTIGTVYVKQGQKKRIQIGCDLMEDDSGLIERATGGRDEEGSNSTTMELDCCCGSSITASFDISLTSGGQGGGAVEVGFMAVKKC